MERLIQSRGRFSPYKLCDILINMSGVLFCNFSIIYFSFFNPLRILYSLLVLSAQALVIILVSVANCTPSFKPLFFHSSVNSLCTSIFLRRWLIQFQEYPNSKYSFNALSIVNSGSCISSNRSDAI